MRRLLPILLLVSTAVAGQVYKCPQSYPGNDAGNVSIALTSASVYWGEAHGDGALVGADTAIEEGIDVHYGLPEGEQGWLVCLYGGRKRVKGRVHDGHEWGQYMISGNREWWIPIERKFGTCDVQIREAHGSNGKRNTWTVTARCKP